ncbi:MAG TPA: hypothetical protein P5254_07600 [Aquihabitans sp.]|nr:hypothetical protein [Aquihabitans sp.]
MKRTTTSAPALRPIRRLAAALLLAGVLVGFATACEPPGCAKDCVTSVAFSPGTDAYTVVLTDDAKVRVTLYNESTRTNAVASKSSNVLQKTHVLTNGAVAPNRTYWYTVTATDAAGAIYEEKGSFKAQKRTLTVKITKIVLTDDSDSVGTGELDFGMKVDLAGYGAKDFGTVYTNHDFGSGMSKDVSISRSIPDNAPNFFTVFVEGLEDDCEGIGSLCTGGLSYSYSAGGSNSDWDWATASKAVTGLPGTNGSGTWSATTSAYALKFTVSGTWTVTYAA